MDLNSTTYNSYAYANYKKFTIDDNNSQNATNQPPLPIKTKLKSTTTKNSNVVTSTSKIYQNKKFNTTKNGEL